MNYVVSFNSFLKLNKKNLLLYREVVNKHHLEAKMGFYLCFSNFYWKLLTETEISSLHRFFWSMLRSELDFYFADKVKQAFSSANSTVCTMAKKASRWQRHIFKSSSHFPEQSVLNLKVEMPFEWMSEFFSKTGFKTFRSALKFAGKSFVHPWLVAHFVIRCYVCGILCKELISIQ